MIFLNIFFINILQKFKFKLITGGKTPRLKFSLIINYFSLKCKKLTLNQLSLVKEPICLMSILVSFIKEEEKLKVLIN